MRSGLDVPTFATRRLHACQRRKVELWARNVRKFCLNADFHVTFRDLLHAVKLRHETDGFTPPPKEGVLRIFFVLKIRRLLPGAYPRTWPAKASTLRLDHRSRCLLARLSLLSLFFIGHDGLSVTVNSVTGSMTKGLLGFHSIALRELRLLHGVQTNPGTHSTFLLKITRLFLLSQCNSPNLA